MTPDTPLLPGLPLPQSCQKPANLSAMPPLAMFGQCEKTYGQWGDCLHCMNAAAAVLQPSGLGWNLVLIDELHVQVLCGFLLLVLRRSTTPSLHCVALHAACLEGSWRCVVVCSGHVAR